MQLMSSFLRTTEIDLDNQIELNGYLRKQYVRCGKENCRCLDGYLHGPYYYRIWREGTHTRKEYIHPQDVEKTKRACALRTQLRGYLRVIRKQRQTLQHAIRHEFSITKSIASHRRLEARQKSRA